MSSTAASGNVRRIVPADPLDVRASGAHCLVASCQARRAVGVGQEKIARLLKAHAVRGAGEARAPFQIAIEADAPLNHPDVGVERELLANATLARLDEARAYVSSRSMTTMRPRHPTSRRWYATLEPTTPPPTMTMSADDGMLGG